MLKVLRKAFEVLKDESGNMQSLTWVLGATVVTVLVVVLLMSLMQSQTQTFFGAASDWIRGRFGF